MVIYLPETGGYEARFEYQEKWFESLDNFEGFFHNWLAKVKTEIDAAFAEWEQEYPLD